MDLEDGQTRGVPDILPPSPSMLDDHDGESIAMHRTLDLLKEPVGLATAMLQGPLEALVVASRC